MRKVTLQSLEDTMLRQMIIKLRQFLKRQVRLARIFRKKSIVDMLNC